MKAVRFDEYGDEDVLKVADVPVPDPGTGQVLVRVKAAGINPGEAKIRDGLLHARWPATFPSGQGSDLAGVVDRLGPGVTTVAAGDEVIGWVDTRSAQAEYAVVDAANLTSKPAAVPWEVAGALRRRRLHRVGGGPCRERSRPATRSSSPARPAASARSPCSSPGGPAPPWSASPGRTTTTGSASTA